MSVFEKKIESRKSVLKVGVSLPNFSGTIVTHDNKFADFDLKDLKKRYVVLIFFPLAFTFVCPTELIALDNRLAQFHERGAEVLAVSLDSHYVLQQWKNTPQHQGGIGNVQYPLFSDITRRVSKLYDVLPEEDENNMDDGEGSGGLVVPFRGTFISDREGILQHYSVNNLGIGRSFDEILRLLDAIQHYEKHGEVCPAGWTKGSEGMKPTRGGVADYLTSNAERL